MASKQVAGYGDGRTKRLEESRETVTLFILNAAEIIEEIQRPPEDERGKVIEFVLHQPSQETLEAMREPTEALPRFETELVLVRTGSHSELFG